MALKTFLRAGFLVLAQRLQESADAMLSAGDLRTRLSDTIQDKFRGSGTWGYYVDHFGDASAGMVIYSCDGDMCRAPYALTANGDNAQTCAIDFEKAEDVVPRTVYETEVEQKESAGGAAALGAGSLKLVERYGIDPAAVELMESTAGTDSEFEVKVIAPGRGSTAFYLPEVLQREASKFKKGTHVYINHATEAEESERPEGDWHKLAGALTSDGYWKESGKHGAGVYAKVGFAPDLAPAIKAKAPYTGMSIRANGLAQMEAAGKVVTRDGVPVLDKFTSVESVDVVTRAGAGGLILTESARTAGNNQQEVTGMAGLSDAEVTELREALKKTNATNAVLLERAVRQDAFAEGARLLAEVAIPDSFKEVVIVNVVERGLPKLDTGALDVTKYGELIATESKRIGAAFAQATGGSNVVDLGGAPIENPDPTVAAREAAELKNREAAVVDTFARLLPGNAAAAALAAKGRAN